MRCQREVEAEETARGAHMHCRSAAAIPEPAARHEPSDRRPCRPLTMPRGQHRPAVSLLPPNRVCICATSCSRSPWRSGACKRAVNACARPAVGGLKLRGAQLTHPSTPVRSNSALTLVGDSTQLHSSRAARVVPHSQRQNIRASPTKRHPTDVCGLTPQASMDEPSGVFWASRSAIGRWCDSAGCLAAALALGMHPGRAEACLL